MQGLTSGVTLIFHCPRASSGTTKVRRILSHCVYCVLFYIIPHFFVFLVDTKTLPTILQILVHPDLQGLRLSKGEGWLEI